MRISDWSSDVCSSARPPGAIALANVTVSTGSAGGQAGDITLSAPLGWTSSATLTLEAAGDIALNGAIGAAAGGLTLDAGGTITDSADLSVARFHLAGGDRSEEHTSELQSLMRISYAVFCLKKKK